MTHPYTKGYFTNKEGSNYSAYEDGKQFEIRAETIRDRFQPTSVLDVGCARGFLVGHLRAMGINANGIDISDWAVGSVPPDGLGSFLTCADVTKGLPYKDGEFDLVISQDFLEHIDEKAIPALIKEMTRVGKRQFHIITTPEYTMYGDETHVCMKPLDWWREQFKDSPDVVLETIRAV